MKVAKLDGSQDAYASSFMADVQFLKTALSNVAEQWKHSGSQLKNILLEVKIRNSHTFHEDIL